MNSRAGFTAALAVVAIAALCGWLVWSASPSASEIAAASSPPAPLPAINLSILAQPTFTERTIHGSLPITTDGVGRDDPFAGTE